MQQIVQYITDFKHDSPAMFHFILAAAIFIAVIVVNIFIRSVLNHLEKKYADHKVLFSILNYSANRPLRLISWIVGLWGFISLVLLWVSKELTGYSPFVTTIIQLMLLAAFIWMLFRLKRRVKAHYIKKFTRTDGGYSDFSIVESLALVANIIIIVITFFSVLAIIHFPLSGFAAIGVVGGFGAYALAQANSILISNIFAGLALYFDRPFAVGDWIAADNGKINGTVTKIGLRLTTIVGFDKRPVYLPNSIFNSTATINPSRMSNRRILQYIGIRYDDFHLLESVLKDIKDYLLNHEEIDTTGTTLVNLVNGSTDMGSSTEGCYGSSSINFMIYTFTKTVNWVKFQNVQDEIMIGIGKIIEKNGAEIAFSTSTLHIPDGIAVNSPDQQVEHERL